MSDMLKRMVKGLEPVQIRTPFLEMFLPLLPGTLEIPVLLTTHTPYESSEITTDLPSQQLILTSTELRGNESKSAFPTSDCGTNGVPALQLGPRGACSMRFFSQHLRNSQGREPVFITNTLSHQAMTYPSLHLLNDLFQKTFCNHTYQELSHEEWFSEDVGTPCRSTQTPLAPLLSKHHFHNTTCNL